MGRSVGKVRFISDGTIVWFIYDSVSDFAYEKLFTTYKEFHDVAWMQDRGYSIFNGAKLPHKCTCGKTEDVELYESYAKGTLWRGKACRNCLIITHNCYLDAYTDSLSNDELRDFVNVKELPDWCNTDE